MKVNNGSGVFSSGADVEVGREPYRVTMSDIDNDGDLDLLAANFADNTVSVRLNGGTGVLAATNPQSANQPRLLLYPNPAQTQVLVSLSKPGLVGPGVADLFNSLGQRVLAGIPLSVSSTPLDVSGLVKSVYFIRAQTEAGPLVERVVIN